MYKAYWASWKVKTRQLTVREVWALRLFDIWLAYRRFRDYEPNEGRLTFCRVWKWVNQFPRKNRDDVARLAANLEYFSKNRIVNSLKRLNAKIVARLSEDGVPVGNIVYLAFEDPPSSSSAMCKLLRDQGGLNDAAFLPATSGLEISKLTTRLREGAIVYVDDFSASATQFMTARNDVRDNIGGFSEFFLLPCICEEALEKVTRQGVEAVYEECHTKSERPLMPEARFLSEPARTDLVRHSQRTWGVNSLGFNDLATNVVFSHGAPDTTPVMFRGIKGQDRWFGIVPRWEER